MWSTELTLIADEQPRGRFEEHTTTERVVYCDVRSVGMRETYEARSVGLTPDYVFILSDRTEYQGEHLCRWDGNLYEIVRTYTKGYAIELTAERVRT